MLEHDELSRAPRLNALAHSLYGERVGRVVVREIRALKVRWSESFASGRADRALSERAALLIAYADQLREPGAAPLRTLATFCHRKLPPYGVSWLAAPVGLSNESTTAG